MSGDMLNPLHGLIFQGFVTSNPYLVSQVFIDSFAVRPMAKIVTVFPRK
jgi:hypothetical protein